MKSRFSIVLAMVFVLVTMLALAAPAQAEVDCHQFKKHNHKRHCNVRNTANPDRT